MSIQYKLLLALVILSLTGVGAALVGATRAMGVATREKMERDLAEATAEFKNQVDQAQERLASEVVATLTDVEVTRALGSAATGEQTEALGLGGSANDGIADANELLRSADFKLLKANDLFVMVNPNGRLLYTLAKPERYGEDVSRASIVQLARKGPVKELWSLKQLRALEKQLNLPIVLGSSEDDLFVIHARPHTRGSDEALLGVVLVGSRVKKTLLPELKRMAHADLVLRASDGMQISTLASLAPLNEAAWSGEPITLPIDGTSHLAMSRDVLGDSGKPLVRALLVRSVDADVQPILHRFRRELAKVFAPILLLSLAVAVVLSRRMSRPLVRLAAAAKQVRLGNLEVSVPVESGDEVGRLAASFNEMTAGLKQRDEIKGLFKRYLDPTVVEELIKHPEKASPGGERRDVTVLFSDLVGFTSMSERMAPEALVALLNDYFEAASAELAKHGATFDKFIGDAIMCFWNAPLPQEDHAARACRTAVGLLRVVDEFRMKMPDGATAGTLRCRIGVNSGPCIVGNIGSKAAQDYTVIGDTVNLASRLEAAAKIYGARSLLSESTLQAANGAVVARELDLLKVRGRGQPVRVYDLVGLPGCAVPPAVQRFGEGLQHYRQRHFADALKAFEASPEDGPSVVFAERCRKLIVTPPPQDWSGVHEVHG